ncbi:hypothetical protein BJX63DRAFT_431071 [Aspergillus granulosus]|uniref:Extracellular serine-rich protein n=1 Tax=Aspergillus granulosus TaxID=176169 RepID=A0ABR4HHT1_9EURO
MVVPDLVLRAGCFFGFLTCDTPPGVWPEASPTWSYPGPPPPWATTTSITSTTTSTSTTTTTTTLPPTSTPTTTITTTGTTSTTDPTETPTTTPTVTVTTTDSTSTSGGPTSTTTTTTSSTSSPDSSTTTTTTGTSDTTASTTSTTVSTTFTTSPSPSTSTTSATTPTSSTSSTTSTSVTSPTTSSTTSSSMSVTTTSSTVLPSATGTIAANILVIARDNTQAAVAYSGLNGYGIPYTTLVVPQAGIELPSLNTSTGGNFGGIVVAGEVSYDYGADGWHSALTDDQWNQLYAYQLAYGVRMVQYDVYPGPKFGASPVGGGCCDSGVEQLISFSDVSDFPTSGLRTGAGVSTQGLWHYPSTITDTATTKQIAVFAAGGGVSGESTAAVINDFEGRQQMVFFIGFDTVWSDTSNYLQHAWITWVTRGLHAGYRRVNLNTQIDDMFLQTEIYRPAGENYRIGTADMDGISAWLPNIRAKLNPGSTYYVEIGHNGNGNIEGGQGVVGWDTCSGGAIYYDSPPATPAEWRKPLGTGEDRWPTTPTSFVWTDTCLNADPLLIWFQAHLNEYAHLSHTFTHLGQNNATYADINKEISFNQIWLERVGFTAANRFTSNGIIPPAITGLHNGDALRAWSDNGITNCVGDNTRPALLNTQNRMWPYFTNVASDGFDGIQVNPRWSTRIYYNCYSPACTTQEWIDTSAGAGDFNDLLAVERTETIRHLFGLSRDGYMFHQANLRNADVDPITVNGETGQFSIFQAWVETVVQEFVRLVNWPIVTITHQQMSDAFLQRYRRDQCGYALSYVLSGGAITGVTLTANGNTCDAAIPITFPTAPSNTHGFTTEQLGNDPVTVWAQLSGSPITFPLASPIAL